MIAKWVRICQKTAERGPALLLVRLLSAVRDGEGDRACSVKGLQTCSPRLPCGAGEHLVRLMKAGNWRKKGIAATLLTQQAAESCYVLEISQRVCTALIV